MIWRKRVAGNAAPRVSNGKRLYAIGDIHGRLDLLDAMLDAIDRDLRAVPRDQARLVFLGDYVDRGDQSAGVVHRLVEILETYDAVCLAGNHDAVFASVLEQPRALEQWCGMGGIATLASYGLGCPPHPAAPQAAAISAALDRAMPMSHHVFLRNRPLTMVSGDYLFVHAGVRPRRPLNNQTEADLLWIRDEFTGCEESFEKFVVHGHTPVPEPDVRHNRINIDTGAFATNRLSCLVLEADERRFLTA